MAAKPGPALARGNAAVLQALEAANSNSNSSSSSNGSSTGSTGSSSVDGRVPPDSPHFSGLVFKLQANMDPKHRDKVAFVRVVSGKFEKVRIAERHVIGQCS